MYISSRAILIRNLSVSVANGIITLIILLIAPLGLAAVIINTLLITVASYFTATAADRIVGFLTPAQQQAELLRQADELAKREDGGDLDRQ
jgi:hypothetical protein